MPKIKKNNADTTDSSENADMDKNRNIVLDFIGENKKKEVKSIPLDIDFGKTKNKNPETKIALEKKDSLVSSGEQEKRRSLKKRKNSGRVYEIVCHTIISGLVLFLVFYSGFVFLVVGCRVDNKILRAINKFLPAPALVSKDIFVDYYQYKDEIGNGLMKDLIVKKEKGLINDEIWSFVN